MQVSDMSDERIYEIIKSFDRQNLTREDRFEGDDKALRDLCKELHLRETVNIMTMVATVIMREAISRGLSIPYTN